MANVFDVAQYILEKTGAISAMKLQKLCYYSQAWSLVWEEKPLFAERIEAWANGPVVPMLYQEHKGRFEIPSIPKGNSQNLNDAEKENIDKVIEFYSKYQPQQLSDLTHLEAPWKAARAGIPDGVRSESEITLASMAEYYGSL